MKKPLILVWMFVCGLLAVNSGVAQTLNVGDPAPEFSLPGTDGQTYTLSDFRGEQAVVLAWFPRAYTRGYTIECKSLAEKGHLIDAYQAAYFMASVDPLEDNSGFATENGATFPLLSDTDKAVARAYGVLHPLGFSRRHTIYIDIDGRIAHIDTDVNPETSAEDIAARLSQLGVAKR